MASYRLKIEGTCLELWVSGRFECSWGGQDIGRATESGRYMLTPARLQRVMDRVAEVAVREHNKEVCDLIGARGL